MKSSIFFFLLFVVGKFSFSQSVGIGTDTPNVNAKLEISSNGKGVLIPRMDSIHRKNISNTNGLLVYDSTTNSFWYNNGVNWLELLNRTMFLNDYHSQETNRNIKTVLLSSSDSAYNIQSGDYTLLFVTSVGTTNATINLPNPSNFKGRILNFVNWSRNSDINLNPFVHSSITTTINLLDTSGSNAHLIIQSNGEQWVEISND